MRTGATLVMVFGLVATLAACAPAEQGGDANKASEGCAPSGSASESIEVSGEFGAKPEISFETPLSVKKTERSVVIEGDGEKIESGSVANIDFTMVNAETGEEVSTTGHTEGTATPITVDEGQFLVGLVKTLECTAVGSRVVGVIPPADLWGDAGAEPLGVTGEQSLVFVADVIALAEPPLERAEGTPQDAPAGFPTVELAEDGTPTVTIPDAAPPADLQIAVLQKADGAVVEDGDTVTVHYQGINWRTGEVFDGSWERGEPTQFPTTGVIEGFQKALVGQNVGSQVIAIIPPAQGYGPAGGNEQAGIAADDTLVFIVDILATS
ncbi:MAG: FKBP-type peptidyl-prolyl cis-trans isomerase [Microbacteriaceae bacterium]